MLNLLSLPLDVQSHIAGFLTRKQDLLSLHKSCRSLHETALAQLYHHVTIKASARDELITTMLSPDNVGLRHLRHVKLIQDSQIVDPRSDGEDRLLYDLAHLLPRDTLLSFSVEGLASLSHCSLLVLYQRQKRLRNLRVDNLTRTGQVIRYNTEAGEHERLVDIHAHLPQCITAARVTALQLCIEYLPSIFESRKLLALCHNVTSLDIDARPHRLLGRTKRICIFHDLLGAKTKEILEYIFGYSDLADNELFGKQEKIRPEDIPARLPVLRLKSLGLRGLDFDTAASVVLSAIQPDQLQSLMCCRCFNVSELLAPKQGTAGYPLNHLKDLSITASPYGYHDLDVVVLDAYLRSFSGLRSLAITTMGREAMLDVGAVHHHSATLRSCYLDFYDDAGTSLAYVPESMKELTKNCRHLEQLALSFDSIELVEDESETSWPLAKFDSTMDGISKLLPHLRSMSILNYPITRYLNDALRVTTPNKHYVDHKLEQLAAAAFSRTDNIRVLCIGRARKYGSYIGEVDVEPRYFVREKRIAFGGGECVGARRVSKVEAHAIEPLSDIFDIEPERKSLPQARSEAWPSWS